MKTTHTFLTLLSLTTISQAALNQAAFILPNPSFIGEFVPDCNNGGSTP